MKHVFLQQTSLLLHEYFSLIMPFFVVGINHKQLARILSRVEIEKSKYYAYRMNKFLEIPLDAVCKDP